MREGGWYTDLDLISRKGRAQRQRRKLRGKNGQNKNIKPIFISDSEEKRWNYMAVSGFHIKLNHYIILF